MNHGDLLDVWDGLRNSVDPPLMSNVASWPMKNSTSSARLEPKIVCSSALSQGEETRPRTVELYGPADNGSHSTDTRPNGAKRSVASKLPFRDAGLRGTHQRKLALRWTALQSTRASPTYRWRCPKDLGEHRECEKACKTQVPGLRRQMKKRMCGWVDGQMTRSRAHREASPAKPLVRMRK